MIYSAFSSELGENSRKVRDLNMTSGTNGVLHGERKQEHAVSSLCPTDCKCVRPDLMHLVIHCEDRHTNVTSLSHEIDSYLLSVAHVLAELIIVKTPLKSVPESVCQLKRLTLLKLIANKRLTGLPDNCFTRLPELQFFAAEQSGFTSIQNGLFDNLTNLQYVALANNYISSIGSHLFDVTANLPNLREIYLLNNNLTEIDTWPVQRAQLINGSVINLYQNHISRFTNSLGWHYDCNSAPLLSPSIDLRGNKIRNLNDMLRGWNITGLFCCINARSQWWFFIFDLPQ